MKFPTAQTILATLASTAYVQAHPKKSQDNAFTMTNAQSGNEVLMYERNPDGTIEFIGAFATGKRLGWRVNFRASRINNALITFSSSPSDGIGAAARVTPDDPLGSQESIVLSPDGRCLFAVNAGSDTVSSFSVKKDSLKLVSEVGTNGFFPVSMAVDDDLLYVLNVGGVGSILGFEIEGGCKLDFFPFSTTSLDAGTVPDEVGFDVETPLFLVSPSQISFTPDGKFLIAIVKGVTDGVI
jgi:6-phosphogluconolactonase